MPDTTTVGQRFSQFIAYLGISKNAFAASLDKTATVIQHLVDERNKPGFDLLCKVFEVYPNLSKDWLLQGVGPMVADELVEETKRAVRVENNLSQSAPTREKPPIAAATVAPAAVSVAQPASEISAPQTPIAPEPEAARPVVPPAAAAAQALTPATSAAPAPANPVDTSWQTALYTQQMAHQLAVAELRNQHLQEQQRLTQQMLDLMQRKM